MAKKIRLHNVTDKISEGIFAVFKAAAGVKRLESRGLLQYPNTNKMFNAAAVGIIIGHGVSFVAVAAMNVAPTFMIGLSMVGAGWLCGAFGGTQLRSIVIAGRHDEQMELLEEEKKKRLAPPKPEQRLA